KYKSASKINKKAILIAVFLVLIGVLSTVILQKTGRINLLSRANTVSPSKEDEDAQTTSTAPTAQSDYSEGDDRQPGNTNHENRGSSVINDTQGNIPSGVNMNQSISSNSGEIVAYS